MPSKILSVSGTVISKNSIVTAHVGSNLEVMPGASVKIVCSATGMPKPRILWEITKENSDIQTIQVLFFHVLHKINHMFRKN